MTYALLRGPAVIGPILTIALALGCGTGGESSPDAEVRCLGDAAWFSENAAGTAKPPGDKAANDYGLYDMLGNTVEWVEDCYHESYEGAPTDGSAWDEEGCEYRVNRGGCYGSTARGVRISVREGVLTSFYGACAPGVRCVRAPGTADVPGAVALTWTSIPAGSFTMGCSPADSQCYDNEEPSHTVNVAGFEMTALEVTQQQYFDQTNEAPSTNFCPECAVMYVTWEKARGFCEALGGRLPTEAEWEYAARGGSETRYYCGNN